jgi:uncharacterized protein (DUF849 family)
MGEKAIVTCAVVGAEVTREQSPAVPYTPEEIARAAVEAWREGAAVVHLHARHPDGRPSQRPEHFRDIVDRIRSAGCDVVIQCSTGGAVGMGVEERLGSLVDGAEMANTWDNVLSYLNTGIHPVTKKEFPGARKFYQKYFQAVFSGEITTTTVTKAIGAYELS